MGGNKIHDEASETCAEAGTVIVDGPGGTSMTMTPNAASRTAERLTKSAGKAEEQRAGSSAPIE